MPRELARLETGPSLSQSPRTSAHSASLRWNTNLDVGTQNQLNAQGAENAERIPLAVAMLVMAIRYEVPCATRALVASFPNSIWERRCPRSCASSPGRHCNVRSSRRAKTKHSFEDNGIAKHSFATRECLVNSQG